MNLYRQTLTLLLAATFLTAECAYAKPKVIDAPSTQMTVRQARKSLAEALSHLLADKAMRGVKINRHKVAFTIDGSQFENGRSFVTFAEVKNLSVMKERTYFHVHSNGKCLRFKPTGYYANFVNEPAAMKFVDALLTLKAAEAAPDTEEEADFATFTASSKTWLEATPKPEMSKDARTYKLLAEDAFKRKDFTAALQAYCDALDKHPMWPDGQYNAALLAAEAEDYELAAQHMRRYLVLAPDAKDTAAANDKLLLWQHKAKE